MTDDTYEWARRLFGDEMAEQMQQEDDEQELANALDGKRD